MEGSTSGSSINSRTRAMNADEFVEAFRNLGFGHDDKNHDSDEGNNGASSSTTGSVDQTQREEVSDNGSTSSNWGVHSHAYNYHPLPSIDPNNIWAPNYQPTYAGQGSELWNGNSDHVNVGANVLGRRDNYMVNENHFSYPLSRIGTGYFAPGNGYYSTSGSTTQHIEDYGPTLTQPRHSFMNIAKNKDGSQLLQKLVQSDASKANIVLEGVMSSIFELIMDKNGHHLFQKLVDAYRGRRELRWIVDLITMQPSQLINAALSQYGSYAILKLIKQLKKTPLASNVTRVLSTSFYELMISPIGRKVIVQCFIHLDYKANQALFEEAIQNCMALATHTNGCVSLNECINYISGDPRRCLLGAIALNSVFLAYDISGNFVLQHVLGLHNEEISCQICNRLRGNYVKLSMTQTGSYVVEKCITLSTQGVHCVVEELVKCKKLVELAKDKFGNYVIQTALKTTKEADKDLYECLVRALKPHLFALTTSNPGALNVLKQLSGLV